MRVKLAREFAVLTTEGHRVDYGYETNQLIVNSVVCVCDVVNLAVIALLQADGFEMPFY